MDFDPTKYGPEVARILAMDRNGQRCAPLVCGPCTSAGGAAGFGGAEAGGIVPGSARCRRRRWRGCGCIFRVSKRRINLIDDPKTHEGEFWHAILHRQEPDPGNAAYWFRRVGQHAVYPEVGGGGEGNFEAVSGRRVSASGSGIRSPSCSFASGRGCSRGRRRNSAAMEIQRAEWQLLFDYSARRAVKLRHLLLVVVLAIVAGGVWYAVTLRNQPPELAFAHVVREPIASSVPTNGKIEPIEWAEARAERDGPVTSIMVQRGAHVAAGAALIELDSAESRAELVAAQARVSQVKADLDVIATRWAGDGLEHDRGGAGSREIGAGGGAEGIRHLGAAAG